MKTNHLLIALVFSATLLSGCIAKKAPVMAVPEGMQARDEHEQAKAALQNLLDQEVERQHIPGMVMAARLADGTVIWATSGYTNPSGNERWSANTPSFVASVTKTFTAVSVMQLVEEGKLTLDDTVFTWFPEQPNGDRITVRMLMSHTSGLAGYDFGTDIEKWTTEWAPEELIAEANKAGPGGEPGGRVARYSNTNYIMLGRIIEKVTGNSWAHEVESRIIQPLGLKDTTCATDDNWKEVAVPGYIRTPDGYLSSYEFTWYPHASTAWAAGGIAYSASDLLTFASALFDGNLTLGLLSEIGWFSPIRFIAALLMVSLHTFYWIALVLMMGTFSESSGVVIAVPMALYFSFWMGTDMIPGLIYLSPLLLAFSPAPEQMSALSVSFMTGEPVFSWLPLSSTVVSCMIFIAVAIQRFNRQEF